MATVLENYLWDKQTLQQRVLQGGITADILWRYGELAYRIGVLETCQAYCKSAPATTNSQYLFKHYQMLDAYIQSLAQERNYGPNRGQDTEKERDAAKLNLSRVIQDYRGRFSSFAPQADNTYGLEVNQVINSIVPAWLQMRETFVPLRPKKEQEDVRR